MLKISDVSQDPTAPSRSRVRPAAIAEARALGFEHCAWVLAVPEDLPARAEPSDDDLLISLVLVHRDKGSILELTRWRWLDDVGVRTLFEDGTVVLTARKPTKGWWKLRWGLASAPRHAYELAFVEVSSLAELVAAHGARVREQVGMGRKPMAGHDLRTYLATRKRWREIADPRMRLRQSIAMKIGLGVAATAATGAGFATKALEHAFPGALLVGAFVSVLAALAIGFGAFVGALWFVAPILARGASVPAPRRARDLLALADSVPRGWLPAPAPASAAARGLARSRAAAASVRELARLQRIDLALGIAGTVVLPVAGFVGSALFGTAAIPTVLGIVFTTDGMIALLTKKTRAQLLRERFVPDLVRAEGEVACTTAACATPFGKKVLGVTWLVGGIACLYAARGALAVGSTPAPAWLVAEWGGIALVSAYFAFAAVKKRHRRLIEA